MTVLNQLKQELKDLEYLVASVGNFAYGEGLKRAIYLLEAQNKEKGATK